MCCVPRNSANGGSWKRYEIVGLIPALAAFIGMAVLSWRKWPDPIIDFGGQLYIPWQLSTGSVLYRDVMYLPGPVSQYYHALLFKLFGVSLTTILVSNFAILLGFVLLVYRMFLKCSDRLTAGMMALAVVIGFGFAQYLDVGNYNYICPYSHEIWHAIVLSLMLVGCVVNWLKLTETKWLFLGGLCYGTIFLTKPENFVAATGIVFLGFLFRTLPGLPAEDGEEIKGQGLWKSLVAFVFASALPLVGMFLVFFFRENAADSLRGVCWAWVPLVTTKMASGPFFKTGMGMDVPLFHLRWMLQHFAVLAAVVGTCAWRFRAQQNRMERIVLTCVLAGLAVNFDWTHSGRALPLILGCMVVMSVLRWRKVGGEERMRLLVPLLWVVFALLLLLKMGVYPRIFHYGVFLAMPAFIAAIYFFLSFLPSFLGENVDPRAFRLVMTILLAIGLARLGIHSALFYKDKTVPIGKGSDLILTYNTKESLAGEAVGQAVSWIEKNTPANATVAALPEGAMINYLTRRRNPTPYIVFMSEIYAFGEETMAAPYRATPPDYLLLVHRETGEYGLDFFGKKKGYGLEMLQWIDANYAPVKVIGAEPLRTVDFGIKILKKK